MFTGVIRAVGQVVDFETQDSSLFLQVRRPEGWEVKEGGSVSVNGACLTVKRLEDAGMYFELMPETLSMTTFGKSVPDVVNLELPLRLSDRLDGHFVTGHVDTVGEILDIERKGDSKIFTVSYPEAFSKLVVSKGSIAVDGVSLTIVDAGDGPAHEFSVSLVSYTLENTTLGGVKVGDIVNLEFDLIAKYGTRSYKIGV